MSELSAVILASLHKSKREYGAELIAPRVRNVNQHAAKQFEHSAHSSRVEVSRFVYKRNPLVDFVAQLRRAVIGPEQPVRASSVLGKRRIYSIGQIESPPGSACAKLCAKDAR
jgi:hypothetical protein